MPALHADAGPLLEEHAVIHAAARGDRSAIRGVLVRVGPAVLGAVRATVGPSHADVEDLVQESLLALVAALPAFRGECSLEHFARRIAVRRAIDGLRAAYRTNKRLAELAEGALVMGAPNAHGLRQEKWRALLAELPAAQTEALLLRALEGCSVDEIAALTGAPAETVRSRLRLAKAALRERLASDASFAELLEDGDD
ncbi:MAG TPA: sigma-70 family RNA polymerase sigma factor [Polyangiaceae bacterium]|nr:sigma-70 family RNA polymerase sigma factor [Polyangiaceae bacterium]